MRTPKIVPIGTFVTFNIAIIIPTILAQFFFSLMPLAVMKPTRAETPSNRAMTTPNIPKIKPPTADPLSPETPINAPLIRNSTSIIAASTTLIQDPTRIQTRAVFILSGIYITSFLYNNSKYIY